MTSKYTLGAIIGSALLGMAKSYGSSSVYARRYETITLSFMDWYAWLNFSPEDFATIDQEAIIALEFTSVELKNPFPEVQKAKMFFNEVLFEGDNALLLNIHVRFDLKPNTFLDLKENISSRKYIDELAGRLFDHAIYHINEFVNNNLPPYSYYNYPSDAKYFDQHEDEGHEDWISDDWNAENSHLFEHSGFAITYGKNNVVIDIRDEFFFTDKDGNVLKKNKPKKSNLRRR